MNTKMKAEWLSFPLGWGIVPSSARFICMSIDKNDSAPLSVIYNLQCRKIELNQITRGLYHRQYIVSQGSREFSPQSCGDKCVQPRQSVYR